jgi:hypothetical protein
LTNNGGTTANPAYTANYGSNYDYVAQKLGTVNVTGQLGTVTTNPSNGNTVIGGSATVNASGGTTNIGVNNPSTNAPAAQGLAALNVGAGALVTLTPHSGSGLANQGALVTASLSVAGGASPTGTIDLTNQALVITATNSTQQAANVAAAAALVNNGYNSGPGGTGSYTGTGITSSVAAADYNTYGVKGLMLIDNTQVGLSSIGGVDLLNDPNQNQVLVMLTFLGDFNGDGKVDASDFALEGYYQSQGLTAQGDLTGTGAPIGASDYALMGYVQSQQSSDPLLLSGGGSAGANGIQAVPEPATNALLIIGIGLFAVGAHVARRRKKHSM